MYCTHVDWSCPSFDAWLLPFPVWLQLGVRAALRSFLVDLFVPKIKLRERERERVLTVYRFHFYVDWLPNGAVGFWLEE